MNERTASVAETPARPSAASRCEPARANSDLPAALSPGVDGLLRAPGEPLDLATRAVMEPRFGFDFSRVRIHSDTTAARSASAMRADAYTCGANLVFASGKYAPDTPAGQRLLAHELTHVIQQDQGRARGIQRRPPDESYSDDPLEREAGDAEFGSHRWHRRPGEPMSYREAMEHTIPPRQRPAAANLQDKRIRVQTADQAPFNDLRTFVSGLPGQLRTLAGRSPPAEPWLTSANVNVQSALRVLDRLVDDLAGERFIVRFDQATTGDAAASYDFLNNEMHLRPFAGDEERTLLAIDLLHEYVHILQDREAEEVFARQSAPHQATRDEDLKREIGARREQVYFGDMLRVMKAPVPSSAIFGSQLSDSVFRGEFETERTATTPKARAAAARTVGSHVETPYQKQLAANSTIKTYAIELDSKNHALLHWDLPGVDSPRDLGAIPGNLADTVQLKAHLAGIVVKLPEYNKLFDRGKGQRESIITFSVQFDGDHITEFGEEAP